MTEVVGYISADFSYDTQKEKCEEFWERELSKITLFPNKEDPDLYAMYRSLVAEILQMFNYPKGGKLRSHQTRGASALAPAG